MNVTVDCKYAGVNLTPSTKRAVAVNVKKDMIVITENKFMLAMASCFWIMISKSTKFQSDKIQCQQNKMSTLIKLR